jgi:hypothetical protein
MEIPERRDYLDQREDKVTLVQLGPLVPLELLEHQHFSLWGVMEPRDQLLSLLSVTEVPEVHLVLLDHEVLLELLVTQDKEELEVTGERLV